MGGTDSSGNPDDDTKEWGITYNDIVYDMFLFTTGDFSSYWIIASKSDTFVLNSSDSPLNVITTSLLANNPKIWNKTTYDPTICISSLREICLYRGRDNN